MTTKARVVRAAWSMAAEAAGAAVSYGAKPKSRELGLETQRAATLQFSVTDPA